MPNATAATAAGTPTAAGASGTAALIIATAPTRLSAAGTYSTR